MTWRNIFDIGEVDLYFFDQTTGTLLPIDDLPSGTVTVVNGVIQCRDLPENYSGSANGVGGVVAIPVGRPAGSSPIRITLSNADIPRVSPSSQVFGGRVGIANLEIDDLSVEFAAYLWAALPGPITDSDIDPLQTEGTLEDGAALGAGFLYAEAES